MDQTKIRMALAIFGSALLSIAASVAYVGSEGQVYCDNEQILFANSTAMNNLAHEIGFLEKGEDGLLRTVHSSPLYHRDPRCPLPETNIFLQDAAFVRVGFGDIFLGEGTRK